MPERKSLLDDIAVPDKGAKNKPAAGRSSSSSSEQTKGKAVKLAASIGMLLVAGVVFAWSNGMLEKWFPSAEVKKAMEPPKLSPEQEKFIQQEEERMKLPDGHPDKPVMAGS